MAPPKLYVGRKIRELREANNATQSAFAERIGISTSYLNQIENNQRPVSAAVLLALAEKFQIDIAEISKGDGDRLLSALSETLSDPLFESYTPNLQELKLVTQNAPGLARALISCHQAYRRNSEQLASLDDTIGRAAVAEPTPYEEVRDFFHFVDNYIHELDVAAERLSGELGIGEAEAGAALANHLESRHGVRVARAGADEDIIRRFDARSKLLFLNPYSPAATRNFQTAFQIAELEMGEQAAALARKAEFRSTEAFEICKIGLYNYFAGALVLPYQLFLAAAQGLRHDIELLATRFGASLEQVAHRLSTLQRPGLKGVPVFFARIDRAGNITKRHSAAKLQFARFGGACPLWNVHQAFEMPGRFIRQLAETPDGVRYLSIATEVTKKGGGYHAPHRRYAITIGCEISYAKDFVYADALDLTNRAAFEPIGISCRICERTNCPQRAVPPLKRRLSVDHNLRASLPYSMI
ncbi:XRE family transcriptional regulator [Pseudaminobacter sp. 19-2017]|uniref:XRE family transcriptional regulator n=1 Tax=Pseudaminobacter soli (ex Zhang et al. 2022) TaxID=2831468 RepID=A0A942IBV2_9HYPH|nr:XRE family transcriptional regulator [Pseudaminobacter soli]MBS3651981.1 XRE family transcriptional regulator [Pseudaminobacter soli]